MSLNKIAVVGAGAWGTTMANHLASKAQEVRLWTDQKDTLSAVLERRCNERYLPGVNLNSKIQATDDMAAAAQGCGLIVWALPVQHLRKRLKQFRPFLTNNMMAINLGKGIEEKTWARPSEILTEEYGKFQTVGSLMGPNIAKEVAQGLFAEATLALSNFRFLDSLQPVFSSDQFKVVGSSDLTGVELAGALKNIVAIAAGMCDGFAVGVNTKSIIVAKGLNEMRRIGVALGANPDSFLSESTLGDLLTSCFSASGRNRCFGESLAKGRSPQDAMEDLAGRVAEGVATCHACQELSDRLRLQLPIIGSLSRLLRGGMDARECLEEMKQA